MEVTKLNKYALVREEIRDSRFYLIRTSNHLTDLASSLKHLVETDAEGVEEEITIIETTEGNIEPKVNEVFVMDTEEEFDSSDFIIKLDNQYVRVVEGTGDNLLEEDTEEGYVDYAMVDSYDTYEDALNEENSVDGGQMLMEKLYRELTLEQIIERVLNFIR